MVNLAEVISLAIDDTDPISVVIENESLFGEANQTKRSFPSAVPAVLVSADDLSVKRTYGIPPYLTSNSFEISPSTVKFLAS